MKTALRLTFAAFVLAAFNLSAASVIQFSATTYTVAEYAGTVALTVQRTNDVDTVVSVDYATADDTATNGLKYTATNGTLAFVSGETNRTIVVQILNEGFAEGTKLFTVTLRNPTNAVLGDPATATVSIRDIDVGIQFQFAYYDSSYAWSLAEDVGTVLIGVVRGDDANIPVTVDMATSDVTARSGVDYIGYTNTLSFTPQERLKFVSISILNDGVKEAVTKSFRATLSNPVGVSLGATKTTTVTIIDNDQGFTFESITNSVSEDAGVALIGVLRGTDDTNSAVTVDFATSDSTAISGVDYVGFTNTLAFALGERRKVVPVSILNDGVRETTKFFRATLRNPTGGAVLGSPTTTTIYVRDNDPGVGFEQASYTNAWGQAAEFAVTVLRGNDGALEPIAVDYATADGTAIAGVDYRAASGILWFGKNETVKSLPITILRERSGRFFRVTLSNPTGGATLGTAAATVMIDGTYATAAPPFETSLTIRREWGVNVLTWLGGGQLQRADSPVGPWQTMVNAKSPETVQSPIPTSFYRVTRPRPVSLHVPASYNSQTGMPLLLFLHGYFGGAASSEADLHLEPLAESRGFLFSYPAGTRDGLGYPYWNGIDCNDFFSLQVDDAGYLRALIQEIGRRFTVDPKRVYLMGHSTGGDMVFTMACHSADLVAAIAGLAGNTYLDTNRCQPFEPVNILSVCGTADEFSNYLGGTWSPTPDAHSPPYPGAVRSVQIWAAYNGASEPVTDLMPTLDISPQLPGFDTVVTRYTVYPSGGAVELWSVINGNHGSALSTKSSPQIIDWLLAHPKP